MSIGWVNCSGECSSPGFTYTHDDEELAQIGERFSYGPGGYQVLLKGRRQHLRTSLASLRTNSWLDQKTRGVSVQMTLLNANTGLFSQVGGYYGVPYSPQRLKNKIKNAVYIIFFYVIIKKRVTEINDKDV